MNTPMLPGFDPVVHDIEAPLSYPDAAGWKATETSREAAQTVDAEGLRRLVVDWLRAHGPHTSDEIAAGLGIDRLSIRPRCSELHILGRLKETGLRRPNVSGKPANVWELT